MKKLTHKQTHTCMAGTGNTKNSYVNQVDDGQKLVPQWSYKGIIPILG